MVALAIVLSVVVLLLAVLVAGLLRSHADILKALHDLGVGVGEPSGDRRPRPRPATRHGQAGVRGPAGRSRSACPSPWARHCPASGTRPRPRRSPGSPRGGDALAVSVTGGDQLTLLAFLSSGCSTCAGFWKALPSTATSSAFPRDVRLVVVTKGPEMEIPGEVAAQAPPGLSVVMSTEAWGDYEVPGSPFFVLVDGRSGRRIGEGVANHFHQVAELVRRAQVDARSLHRRAAASRAYADGLDGPGTGAGQRPGADGGRDHARRPEPLPVVARRRVRTDRPGRPAAAGRRPTGPTTRAG